MAPRTEGTFKLRGRLWRWRTRPNADKKNHPYSSWHTTVQSGGLKYSWLHSDPLLNPRETLELQFLLLKDRA